MAHFAELDDQGYVTRVVVVSNEAIQDGGADAESLGIDLMASLYGHRRWRQTSYSGSMRKNFAGVGMQYDAARDAFIGPQPFPSWSLDETTCRWTPPVSPPTSGLHRWDESGQKWVQVLSAN